MTTPTPKQAEEAKRFRAALYRTIPQMDPDIDLDHPATSAALEKMLEGVVIRVPCHPPLSRMQLVTVALLAEGYSPGQVSSVLGVTINTVDYHIREAAKRIPGDLHRTAKCVAWYRGASMVVLTGGVIDEHNGSAHLARARKMALSISRGRGCPVCGYDGVQVLSPVPEAKR
jgi:hypothetical protein